MNIETIAADKGSNGKKTQDRKMDNQKMRLKYNKNHSIQNKTNNRDNIIKDKNQLNDNKNNVCQLSTSVLD